jgi:lipopolysaccharide export system permease protein
MKTIRSFIGKEIGSAVAFVTLGFVALFFFFDLVEELSNLGNRYRLRHALTYVLLIVPSRLYELLPICVLIGTMVVMARLAQSSEFTILRTSGMGPWRALRSLLLLGSVFVLLTFFVGDYLTPAADRMAQIVRAQNRGESISLGATGAWLKERQTYGAYAVNVGALANSGELQGVKIYEFDGSGLLQSITQAKSAVVAKDDSWTLREVTRREYGSASDAGNAKPLPQVGQYSNDTLRWPTAITAEMVSVALLKPERMGTVDLWRYINHLESNNQDSLRYEIQFWKKMVYPLSCLVMVVLALPFAYLHFRNRAITTYVFIGVMIGISFFLLNTLFSFAGNLNNWMPWFAATAPSLLYMLLSLGAFTWLVLRR